MAADIRVNIEAVGDAVGKATSQINKLQENADDIYNSLTGIFAESAGEEADALRDQQKAEAELVRTLTETLSRFVSSIQFAAEELSTMDSTGAQHMTRR
nr:hypothetical protein [uncultured Mediterraneibacter sp.]